MTALHEGAPARVVRDGQPVWTLADHGERGVMSTPWGFTCTRCGLSVDNWPSAEAAAHFGNVHANFCPGDHATGPDPDYVGQRYFNDGGGSRACRRCGAVVGFYRTSLHDQWHADMEAAR